MLKIAKWVPYFGKKYLHWCTRHTAVWLQLEKTLILGWCFFVFTVALLHVGGMLWLQCSPQNVCHIFGCDQSIFRGVQPTNLLPCTCITWGLCHTEERRKDTKIWSPQICFLSYLLKKLHSQKHCMKYTDSNIQNQVSHNTYKTGVPRFG